MARQAHGHDADRLDVGPERRQLLDGALQPRPVVELRNDDELGVHLHVALGQPAELRHDVRRVVVAQEAAAHRRIGDVDGDVERRQPHRLDTPPVMLAHVRQGDEVAEEEGVAVVVVLDIEGAPHAWGHLQDEAELAQVVAAANVRVEGRG